METVEQLRPIFEQHWPNGWDEAPPGYKWTDVDLAEVAKLRHKARTNHFFLGNQILDCDFYVDVHTGLFDAMVQKDPTKPLEQQDSIKRRLILWSRGHYKTTAEVVEITQLILCFPNITILVVSGKKDLVKEILSMTKGAFENNKKLRELFPEFCGKKLGNQSMFSVPNRKVSAKQRGGTVNVSTPKSVKSGLHADVVFLDDLQHDKNWQKPELLEGVRQEFFNFSGPILGEGFLYVLGTRYVQGDLYATILDTITEKGAKPLKEVKTYQISPRWQAANHVSADNAWYVSIRSCWRHDVDGTTDLLFPQRGPALDGKFKGFTLETLSQIQRSKPDEFACHYENLPLAGGASVFTEEVWTPCEVVWDQVPKRGTTVAIWDLSWGKWKNADENAGIVLRITPQNKWYVIDHLSGRFDPDTLTKQIIILHNKHHCHTTFMEEAQGAPWLATNVINYCKLIGVEAPNISFIQPKNSKNIKDLRIRALVPMLRSGRLFVFAGFNEYEKFKKAFIDYPNAQHDDIPDALSMLLDVVPFVDPTPSRMERELMRVHTEEQARTIEANPFGGIGGILNG